MYNLPNFCRVCLKYDKTLIDLEHLENEPDEPLLLKLQHCVGEVEWSLFKPLLCQPCIKRLNAAYTFKKQCVQSSTTLKNYITLVKDSTTVSSSASQPNTSNAYVVMTNEKYIKVVMHNDVHNAIQVLSANGTVLNPLEQEQQHPFINLSNTFQKFVPIAPNLDQSLLHGKTEELSVEIDPTDLLQDDTEQDLYPEVYNFVPILPKQSDSECFGSGQHFLSFGHNNKNSTDEGDDDVFSCERCKMRFTNRGQLRKHLKGCRMTLTCTYCANEYASVGDFAQCMLSHKSELPYLKDQITLEDLNRDQIFGTGAKECFKCNVCRRQFRTNSGFFRHKARMHNETVSKKKFFIKGVKIAKCDICNKEFSTHSYMLLHRDLHLRKERGYNYRVMGAGTCTGEKIVKIDENINSNATSIPMTVEVKRKKAKPKPKVGKRKRKMQMLCNLKAAMKMRNLNRAQQKNTDKDEGHLVIDEERIMNS